MSSASTLDNFLRKRDVMGHTEWSGAELVLLRNKLADVDDRPARSRRLRCRRDLSHPLTECDDKLAKYRQALEAGTDPTIVSEWITEVKLARKAAEIALRPKTSSGRLTAAEIRDLVGQLKGIVAILANAEPADRKAVYSELNLSVVYHDDGRMQVSAGPDACTNKCVGGGT